MVHLGKKFIALLRHLVKDESGVAAIEFGVVATVLTFMLVGGTDLGLAARHRSQMEGAVRAGLQKALDTGASLTEVQDAALGASDLPQTPTPTATAEYECHCPDGSDISCATGSSCGNGIRKQTFVSLTLAQEHRWLLGIPWVPNPSNLSITHSLRVD
jgi:Flp pilus assembly pilin Flp